MATKVCIIEIPVGTRIRYEYPGESGPVVIEGVRGEAIGGDHAIMSQLGNRGFYVTDDSGHVHRITRYARVEVITQ